LPNLISTAGAFVLGLGALLFVVNGIVSLYRGAIAGPNPWGAATLEWATSSPPPVYNFAHAPVVESNTPLWDLEGELPVVTGLRVDQKEMLLTTVVAAAPDTREPVPEPSLWPFISAVAVGIVFIASIFSPWAVAVGVIPCFIALTAWFWPKELKRHPEPVIS
jgi:cytochrome c oxidase subunit 1